MKLKENSTHKAIKENGVINIYRKGLTEKDKKDLDKRFVEKYLEWFKDELLWTIPVDEEDDLFAIFERLDEDNRILRTECEMS